ncbi:acyl-CoA N-acyltransferase [Microdochium bolleyi]|uniref:Acyl-CoA N-acyltransferase n=1 Tax=Microdochium bolleyi TaxID=196109 RepID=A0A136IZR8_9PEZI|nr:acyl-CoA N-acyltransferase [Microdochium bolleyi]
MSEPKPSLSPQKPKVQVTIRNARFKELPTAARIMTLAFWDDQIFGNMIHPEREKYPLDSDLYWLRERRINFWNPHIKLLVATIKDADAPDGEKVIGIAEWERLGEGSRKLERTKLDPRNLMKPLMSKAMAVHERLYPDRAASPANLDVIARTYPFFDSIWSGDRGESWYLSFLAVHPDHQGIGAGKKLTQWGLDRAQEEGVVASVITAVGTEEFYARCGFDETLGCARDGEGNPLTHLEGLDIMWKWPERT